MDILEIAIQKEAGVGKLARELGVAQNVVSNWRSRGVPNGWVLALQLKYGTGQKACGAEQKIGAAAQGH